MVKSSKLSQKARQKLAHIYRLTPHSRLLPKPFYKRHKIYQDCYCRTHREGKTDSVTPMQFLSLQD